jgi:hypothetical protein
MRSLLLVESFDSRRSKQYILVRVIPSCFRFAKIFLCQVSLLSMCIPRHLISTSWGSCTLFMWTGGRGDTSLFVQWMWRSMAGSLSVATTTVSSAKVAVVDFGEVGRSAVCSRYNNGRRIQLGVHPHWLGRVLCTQFQPLRGSVCYANRILG